MLNVLDGEMNVQGKIRGTKKMVKAMIEQFDSIPKKEGVDTMLQGTLIIVAFVIIAALLMTKKIPDGCSYIFLANPAGMMFVLVMLSKFLF